MVAVNADLSPLEADVVALLEALGPTDAWDLRMRLCVASKARMDAALFVLRERALIERTKGSDTLRVTGDTRPVLANDLHAQMKRRWLQRRHEREQAA